MQYSIDIKHVTGWWWGGGGGGEGGRRNISLSCVGSKTIFICFQKKKKKKKTACLYDYVTLYAQSVDLRNPGIVLRKPWIHGLWYNPPCMDWPRNPGIAHA